MNKLSNIKDSPLNSIHKNDYQILKKRSISGIKFYPAIAVKKHQKFDTKSEIVSEILDSEFQKNTQKVEEKICPKSRGVSKSKESINFNKKKLFKAEQIKNLEDSFENFVSHDEIFSKNSEKTYKNNYKINNLKSQNELYLNFCKNQKESRKKPQTPPESNFDKKLMKLEKKFESKFQQLQEKMIFYEDMNNTKKPFTTKKNQESDKEIEYQKIESENTVIIKNDNTDSVKKENGTHSPTKKVSKFDQILEKCQKNDTFHTKKNSNEKKEGKTHKKRIYRKVVKDIIYQNQNEISNDEAYHKKYYEKNKAKVLAVNRKYYEKNKEEIQKKRSNYRKTSSAKTLNRKHTKCYYNRNTDACKQTYREYYEKNRKSLLQNAKVRYAIKKGQKLKSEQEN